MASVVAFALAAGCADEEAPCPSGVRGDAGSCVCPNGAMPVDGFCWEEPEPLPADAGPVDAFVPDAGPPDAPTALGWDLATREARLGRVLALSADGRVLAASADATPGDRGVTDERGPAGIQIFERGAFAWSHRATLPRPDAAGHPTWGAALALSGDGATLAVAAPNEPGPGDEPSGAVYVYVRGDDGWALDATLISPAPTADAFGRALAFDVSGDVLVVGAPEDASAATEVDGDASDTSAPGTGAAHVFVREAGEADEADGRWAHAAYLKAPTEGARGVGGAVAPSADASRIALAAWRSPSAAAGVHVFVREGGRWRAEARVLPAGLADHDDFGVGLALDAAGETLAVGAPGEASDATGVGGDPTRDTSASGASGAVWVFARGEDGWAEAAYLKAANADGRDRFGMAVALASDGDRLAVGAPGESGSGEGMDPLDDDDAPAAGAVYLFERSGARWAQAAYVKPMGTRAEDGFGRQLALGRVGRRLASSVPTRTLPLGRTSAGTPNAGLLFVYDLD